MSPALVCLALVLACALATGAAAQSTMPREFVYLRDIDPSIRQDIRYAGSHNFVGRPIAGYAAAECVLTAKAAQALMRVQTALASRGYGLIVWDCYRPARAVADFMRWTKDPDTRMRAAFYPHVDKSALVGLGYIAARSTHSSGSTVDAGLVALAAAPAQRPSTSPLESCAASGNAAPEQGSVDLGTSFDCFDELANFANPAISANAREHRALLRRAMTDNGFAGYEREWWHFRLVDDPFRGRAFDFPIAAPPRPGTPLPRPRVRMDNPKS